MSEMVYQFAQIDASGNLYLYGRLSDVPSLCDAFNAREHDHQVCIEQFNEHLTSLQQQLTEAQEQNAALQAALEEAGDVLGKAVLTFVGDGTDRASILRIHVEAVQAALASPAPPRLAKLEAVAGLLQDAQTRLTVAENAKPSNMRLGQVRELRWWVNRLADLERGTE